VADEYVFDLSGGRLCLDFANTVGNRNGQRPSEHLNRYCDLVGWGRQAGLLPGDDAWELLREGAGRPAEAENVLVRARALREALYTIFSARAAGRTAPAADLAQLNAALPEALARLHVAPAGHGFVWHWRAEPADLDRMLWPVLRSAAELLTSDDLPLLRLCASETCAWLFMDTSRNRTRRWCDMKVCGNRAKARRHYRRRRDAAAGPLT
jgi:predicted RNA-binding Zn ribbon-like protein